jgi:hypothetical protein
MAAKTKEETEREEREERAEQQKKQREQQQQEQSAKEQEQQAKKAADKLAKLPPHAQKAHQETKELHTRMNRALDKLKFRLADGTFTENELSEIQVTLAPIGEKMGVKSAPQKSAKELSEEPPRPAQMGKPRPEMQKSQSNVEHMIEQCLANMERQQEKIDNVESSEEEIMEARESYEAMVNKLERLTGPTNPGEA